MSGLDAQWMFNALFTVIGVLGGWLLNNIRDAIRDLEKQDEKMSNDLKGIEVSLAGGYMTRAEVNAHFETILSKLDKIAEKIDRKADK